MIVAAHTIDLALCLLLFGFEHHISNKHAEEAKQRHKSKHRNQNGIFLRQKVLVHKMISINERLKAQKKNVRQKQREKPRVKKKKLLGSEVKKLTSMITQNV